MRNRCQALIGVLLVLRLYASMHLGLGDDEAYYWDWQNHLALGYFDHPPLTAWILGFTQIFLPRAVWALRLPFVLISLSGVWPFLKICRHLQARSPITNTLYVFFLIPFFSLAGFMVFPDVPMVAAWIWALYFTLEIESRPRATKLWFGLGAALGFALLSKLTALLLGGSVFIWSLSSAQRRRDWLSVRPWLALLVTILLFSPVLVWNARHGFPTIKFQLLERHAQELRPSRELSFLLVQLALLSPLGLYAVFRELRPRRVWVYCFALPSLIVFWLQPLKADFMIHWAAPAYLPLLAVVDWSKLRGRSINLVYLISVNLLFPLICLFPILPVNEPRQDFSNDFYGWSDTKPWLNSLYATLKAQSGKEPRFITSRYQLAGNLSFYSGHLATAVGPRANAYRDFANYPVAGDDEVYLFVADNRYREGPEEVGIFRECKAIGEFATKRFGKDSRSFKAWGCYGFKGAR